MDITKLTPKAIISYLLETNESERMEKLKEIQEYAIQSENGKKIPEGIYQFLRTKEYPLLLANTGMVRCIYSSNFFPKNDCIVVYRNYHAFRQNEESYLGNRYVSDCKKSGSVVEDEVLGKLFTDRKLSIYDENFNLKTVAATHLSYKIDNGEWFNSTTSRRGKTYSMTHLNFWAHGASPKDWAVPEGDTVGAEIEMLFPSLENKLRFSSWVGKNFSGWACEYDGSLEDYGNAGDCGLELISPPLLVPDMNKQITTICEKAVELGGQGFTAGVFYGMHVTILVPKAVSRSGPSRTTIASRYIAMFNNPKLRPFWQLVARRKGESFNQYCPFKDVSLDNCLNTERGDGDRHAHRRSVFVRNPTLLETRIFRANLSGIQVRANIEICNLVMQYSKSPSFNLDDIKAFYDFLHAHMSKDLRACLYRKKNTPIKVLSELAMDSAIESEPELELSC